MALAPQDAQVCRRAAKVPARVFQFSGQEARVRNIGGANTGFAKQTKDAGQVKHDTTAQCFFVGSQIVTQGEKTWV